MTPDAEFVSNFEVRAYFHGKVYNIVKTTEGWSVLWRKQLLYVTDNPNDAVNWLTTGVK